MTTRELTCIGCPMGCALTVKFDETDMTEIVVSGNTCPRGKEYAVAEVTNPTRIVTGTLGLTNRRDIVVSVKTKSAVPKSEVLKVAEAMQSIQVSAPLHIGDVAVSNIAGTQCDLVVTRAVE